jgi:TrmH family RNA methyltransferase
MGFGISSRRINYNNWFNPCSILFDPGNLGTILRLCDWFGVKQILCSKETVDIYNPKVVQATMGSIGRVNVIILI